MRRMPHELRARFFQPHERPIRISHPSLDLRDLRVYSGTDHAEGLFARGEQLRLLARNVMSMPTPKRSQTSWTFAVGQKVTIRLRAGGYAEVAVVSSDQVIPLSPQYLPS